MSSTTGNAPDREVGSWATETLPLAVRKELLERELAKLGFNRKQAHGFSGGHDGGGAQHRQQVASTGHPQADAPDGGGQHAD